MYCRNNVCSVEIMYVYRKEGAATAKCWFKVTMYFVLPILLFQNTCASPLAHTFSMGSETPFSSLKEELSSHNFPVCTSTRVRQFCFNLNPFEQGIQQMAK